MGLHLHFAVWTFLVGVTSANEMGNKLGRYSVEIVYYFKLLKMNYKIKSYIWVKWNFKIPNGNSVIIGK